MLDTTFFVSWGEKIIVFDLEQKNRSFGVVSCHHKLIWALKSFGTMLLEFFIYWESAHQDLQNDV